MENKLTLNEIGIEFNSDKSSKWHDYLELYDKHFNIYRDKKINILEIGILFGDSLIIFYKYFENAMIYGLDIEDKSHLNNERITTIHGDQSDEILLSKFEDDSFSIILDDGSHKMFHQQMSFGFLFKKLKSGGIYVIEDLHTSFDEYSENISHGNSLFGIEDGNRTMDFLKGIQEGNYINKYLSEEQYKYLLENIESIEIVETSRKDNNTFSITSIIRKK
jgi:hypothetical protein